MKLDSNSQVYINCKTEEERNAVMDILRSLNCHWPERRGLGDNEFHHAPMHIELDKQQVRHGRGTATSRNMPFQYPILDAIHFKNQWIALKKHLDK